MRGWTNRTIEAHARGRRLNEGEARIMAERDEARADAAHWKAKALALEVERDRWRFECLVAQAAVLARAGS